MNIDTKKEQQFIKLVKNYKEANKSEIILFVHYENLTN